MRVLSEEQVMSLVDDEIALRAVERADRQYGETPETMSRPPVLFISGPRPPFGKQMFGQFVAKGASAPQEGAAGILLYNRDHPYVFLWDIDSSLPIGMVACDWLSVLRVGMTALVGARHMAPPTVRKIALIGGGRFMRDAARLVTAEWPDAAVSVVTTRLETAEAFARTLTRGAVATESHEQATRGADLIISMTSAGEPLVKGEWLEPGVLVLSMGGDHEFDISALHACDALIVDSLPYAMGQGDLGAWLRRGEISEDEIGRRLRGTIGDVVSGAIKGRNGADERIFAVLQGLTACDVAVAKVVLDRAAAAGVGQLVNL